MSSTSVLTSEPMLALFLTLAGLRMDVLVDIAKLAQSPQNMAAHGLETHNGSSDDDLAGAGEDNPAKPVYRSNL